jgi:hypothetical protein
MEFFINKLKSASDREFYSLNDALRQFTKVRFLENSNFVNSCIASYRE